LDDQWEMMNKKLMQIEEETRQKVDHLTQELAEKDNIIQQLSANIEELTLQQGSKTAAAPESDKLRALKEQVGVFQEINKQLETEKRALETEVKDLKEKGAISDELNEQLTLIHKKSKQLESEKLALEAELTELKGKGANPSELQEKFNALLEENKLLYSEKESLESQIRQLKEKAPSAVESGKPGSAESFETEKKALQQQVQNLEAENKKLTRDLEDINKELDEIFANNKEQSQKIEELEATLAQVSAVTPSITAPPTPPPLPPQAPSPPPQKAASLLPPLRTLAPPPGSPPIPAQKAAPPMPRPLAAVAPPSFSSAPRAAPAPSAPTISKYFIFNNGAFLPTDKKPQGIILEINVKDRLWILTIEPSVSFLDKNKALRVARSLPATGMKGPDGDKVGVGFELKIFGEF
jgi:phage shock protein A